MNYWHNHKAIFRVKVDRVASLNIARIPTHNIDRTCREFNTEQNWPLCSVRIWARNPKIFDPFLSDSYNFHSTLKNLYFFIYASILEMMKNWRKIYMQQMILSILSKEIWTKLALVEWCILLPEVQVGWKLGATFSKESRLLERIFI